MKNPISKAIGVTAVGLLMLGVATNANAVSVSMTIDTVLADDASIVPADASATMVADNGGSTLTITLCNMFNGSGAGGLLTGLGFDMPDSYDILSGTVVVDTGSVIVSSDATLNGLGGGTDVSGEWGYNNGISGHFNDFSTATDTQVSSMVADGTTMFSTTPLDQPPADLDGPEWGLLGPTGTTSLHAIRNCVVITLALDKTINNATAFLNGIDGNEVAVTYGSPTYRPPSMPDGGSTFAMLGFAIVAVEFARRRFLVAS